MAELGVTLMSCSSKVYMISLHYLYPKRNVIASIHSFSGPSAPAQRLLLSSGGGVEGERGWQKWEAGVISPT